ncbi:hypothetical protein BCV69DRAFT_143812 [Microstroma glucosiphilum]|uniref:Uncharacterized protein n=1 Tax=Pseudomicrostroma glucosiphilum TaxID=1684307 RepID=A0A316UGY0_9BASI|nr:hypothetical protein BCV69DRAFT_143812 [Pseudomicrostroma glucosiphilum]PWN22435.1 hypothetical protein BCV69DRAFT_143812 [Pseudomicrostroma glucosiphilum]
MPCQEQRPCPRCLKRGIPELCIDAEPIARRPRKEGERQQEQEQSQQQQQQSQQSLAQDMPFDYPEGMADIRQLAKAAHAANSALGSGVTHTPPQMEDAAGADGSQEVPRAAEVLTQAGEIDALRSSLQPTAGDLLDKYGYLPLRILADAEVTPTSGDAGAAKDNFSWTRSYAELARWVVSDLPARVAAEVDSVVTSQRSQLLQEGARVSEELAELEAASVASMDGAVHSVLEGIPLPVVLLRRSGEVYAKNTLASNTFALLQPTTQDNFIKYGFGQHAVSIAKLIKMATTDSLNYAVSDIVPLITSGDGSQPSAPLAQSRFVLTMEAKEWVRASDVAGRAERSTRLPLFVTCVLTPLDAAAAAGASARLPLR